MIFINVNPTLQEFKSYPIKNLILEVSGLIKDSSRQNWQFKEVNIYQSQLLSYTTKAFEVYFAEQILLLKDTLLHKIIFSCIFY